MFLICLVLLDQKPPNFKKCEKAGKLNKLIVLHRCMQTARANFFPLSFSCTDPPPNSTRHIIMFATSSPRQYIQHQVKPGSGRAVGGHHQLVRSHFGGIKNTLYSLCAHNYQIRGKKQEILLQFRNQ